MKFHVITGALCFLSLLFVQPVPAQQVPDLRYKVAIIGNPANPDIRYDKAQLSALKQAGFNTLQLNIAWGARPADEPLNLEDILYVPGIGDSSRIKERCTAIRRRAQLAKQWGFRTLFHFGAPRVDSLYKILTPELIDIATEKNSIRKKEIVEKYKSLLTRLHAAIPEIDDILVYTFDQEAWVANEFGNGPTDRNIPLHERLPDFLHQLTDTWAALNPQGRLWWEPWEISAGQLYACIPRLPLSHFGLCIHANIAEVQLTRPVDVWFRNMVNLLSEKKIPVIGEIFMSGATEEVEPLQHVAAPRLVFEEIAAMYAVKNISGVKEYYGLLPDRYDPSQLMAAMKLKEPSVTLEAALRKLSEPYGTSAPVILAAWEATAKGLQLFPWDCSWRFRRLPDNFANIHVYHRWDAAEMLGSVAPSPSWKSTRRSLFMITENERLDPWFYEDIELRSQAAADQLLSAISRYEKIPLNTLPGDSMRAYLSGTIRDLKVLEQSMRAFQCYCREVNLAFLMRKYVQQQQAIPEDLLSRFRKIMETDITNQQKGFVKNHASQPTATEMLQAFNSNPAKWVEQHLVFR